MADEQGPAETRQPPEWEGVKCEGETHVFPQRQFVDCFCGEHSVSVQVVSDAIAQLRAAETPGPRPDRLDLGEASIRAFAERHANDRPVDPSEMVRFSQRDMDAATKPLHAEIERLRAASVPPETKKESK